MKVRVPVRYVMKGNISKRLYERRRRRKLLLILSILLDQLKFQRQRKLREYWVHPVLQERGRKGEFNSLCQDLRSLRQSHYQTYFRMTPQIFDDLVSRVESLIKKQETVMRKPIPPAERLAITLRFLATGDSFETISKSFRCGKATVSKIVPETCSAIWDALVTDFMPIPTHADWMSIATKFAERWNFPNCVGSVDGKHVVIQKPALSGSVYFNYKKTFSMVLMAVVDAEYRFVAIDTGSYGRMNDSQIFSSSSFGKLLAAEQLQLPPDAPLPGNCTPTPFVFVADEAFPLGKHMMRPFPRCRLVNDDHRIFNYRLSRARRTVENAFGIMSSRFRVFRRPICLLPAHVDAVVKACTILHNFLLGNRDGVYCGESPANAVSTCNPPSMQGLTRTGRRASEEARRVQRQFVKYFVSRAGAVSWQEACI